MDQNKIKQGGAEKGEGGGGGGGISVWTHKKKQGQCENTDNIPADNNAVVEQVDLDVLDSDGLVEALRDQQPQEPPQVWSVVQGHPHLGGEALQQWQQHGPGVDLSCMQEAQHAFRMMSAVLSGDDGV